MSIRKQITMIAFLVASFICVASSSKSHICENSSFFGVAPINYYKLTETSVDKIEKADINTKKTIISIKKKENISKEQESEFEKVSGEIHYHELIEGNEQVENARTRYQSVEQELLAIDQELMNAYNHDMKHKEQESEFEKVSGEIHYHELIEGNEQVENAGTRYQSVEQELLAIDQELMNAYNHDMKPEFDDKEDDGNYEKVTVENDDVYEERTEEDYLAEIQLQKEMDEHENASYENGKYEEVSEVEIHDREEKEQETDQPVPESQTEEKEETQEAFEQQLEFDDPKETEEIDDIEEALDEQEKRYDSQTEEERKEEMKKWGLTEQDILSAENDDSDDAVEIKRREPIEDKLMEDIYQEDVSNWKEVEDSR